MIRRVGMAYLRCSDARQDKSIDQQREEIARRAEADGVVIPAANWFIDEGLSGKTTKKRMAYKALLARAEVQLKAMEERDPKVVKIEVLYVWGISRIARNMYDCLKALAALDDAKIEVVSLTEPDTGDDSLRKLIRPILAWLAERYIEELKKNVLRGMSSQAALGYWLHPHVPHGYRPDESTRKDPDGPAKLMVDPETSKVIRRIRDLRLVDQLGYRVIAEQLHRDREAHPGRDDRDRAAGWEAKHIKRIMVNPAYTGSIVFTPRDKEGHPISGATIVCENAHEALMSKADQEADAALCRIRERSKVTNNPVRLGERGDLTPWLVCARCGGKACIRQGGVPGNRTYSYGCTAHHTNREVCEGFSVRVDLIDPMLLARIEADVLTAEGLTALIKASLDHLRETPDTKTLEAREALLQEEREFNRKIQNIVAVIADMDDATELKLKLREYQTARQNVRDDLVALPAPGPLPDASDVSIEAFRTSLLADWRASDVHLRRKALAKLVKEIVMDPNGTATIRYSWSGEGSGYGVQSPSGPPKGSAPINRRWVLCGEVSRPKVYRPCS